MNDEWSTHDAYLPGARTAETNPAGRSSADAAPRTAGSRTAPKKNLSVVAAGILVALTCSILLSLNAIGVTGPTAPSVQLASAVTNVDEHGEPRIRALSGPTVPLEPVSTASQRNALHSAKGYLDYTRSPVRG